MGETESITRNETPNKIEYNYIGEDEGRLIINVLYIKREENQNMELVI